MGSISATVTRRPDCTATHLLITRAHVARWGFTVFQFLPYSWQGTSYFMILKLGGTLSGLPGTDPPPTPSAVAPLWSAYVIASDAHFLSWFTDAKTTTKWKKLATWWPWALSPQTYWRLRIDSVNPCNKAPLCLRQPITELYRSWSQTRGPPPYLAFKNALLKFKELMLSNCGVGEDSWESLGLQGDPTSPS